MAHETKKDKSAETALQAIGVALITAFIEWLPSDPISAGVAVVGGLGALYCSIHWRNIRTSITKEEARNIADEVGDFIEEKYRNK